ncbi:hypothetical protein [Bradyrhizobium embrapense]
MADDGNRFPENLGKRVCKALQAFSTDELRQLLAEIERTLRVHSSHNSIDDPGSRRPHPARARQSELRLVGGAYMDKYIAQANIDHYLGLLKDPDVPGDTRTTITKLLLAEEDKLGHQREQLEFAESRAAACRQRADRQRRLMNAFAPGSTDRMQAERLLVNFDALTQFVEGCCHQMRRKANESSL